MWNAHYQGLIIINLFQSQQDIDRKHAHGSTLSKLTVASYYKVAEKYHRMTFLRRRNFKF